MAALLMVPAAAQAGMDEGPCWVEDQEEPSSYCWSYLHWLPQYVEDFDVGRLSGRYAVDCAIEGGIWLTGTGIGDEFNMIRDGHHVGDAEIVYSYFGNHNPPVAFILGVLFDGYERGITVNGDHNGFYIIEEWENGRRLSQCEN
ncbi:hypothetical protein ACW9UR_15660 [Halovulum sp. GXIMD14794]